MKQQEKNQTNRATTGTYHHENLLQAVWASLRFDRNNLHTTQHETIRIHHPGIFNTNQGPDFLDAQIQIGDHYHHGHVEIHLNADDWMRHGHHLDPQYNAVVLHVYLLRGKRSNTRIDGTEIPELYLGDRVGTALDVSMKTQLACHGIGKTKLPASPSRWMQDAGYRRLIEKSERMGLMLQKLDHDWSQLLWEELAGAVGGPVNALQFKQLAKQVPWALVRRHNYTVEALEALLFGICGALEGRPIDAYQAGLQDQWRFMQGRHNLQPKPIPFKFHRMHPAGFPMVRIAQLAALVAQYRPIIALLEEKEIKRFAEGSPPTSAYWACRYEFGNRHNQRKSELGAESRHRIILNVLLPMLRLYAINHGLPIRDEAMLAIMAGITPENDRIVRRFGPIGVQAKNALESQGLHHIEQKLCRLHRCQSCVIGSKILGLHQHG